jgi:hypothetical protein
MFEAPDTVERELFCLSCGVELPESLRHTESLRCHDCRDVEAPISSDLARRAREISRAQSMHMFEAAA